MVKLLEVDSCFHCPHYEAYEYSQTRFFCAELWEYVDYSWDNDVFIFPVECPLETKEE